ncbi:hypothetical protein KY331_03805 [Candidatus Woesearchaeota archaeon]|nr:hypothetical protein [Candidatus Woesearchaeota archaeon]
MRDKTNPKAQVSMEYVMLVGFTFLIIIPLIAIGFLYSSESEDQIITSQIGQLSKKIVDAAEEVYYYGAPAKTVIDVYIPKNIKSANIVGNTILFKVQTINGITDVAYSSPVSINGTLPDSKGLKHIKVEAKGNYVWISE